MLRRYSSRLQKLDETFLNRKLAGARSYDRLAGYFCSSILEVAGEAIEGVTGTVRVICNANLRPEDVTTAAYAQKMRQEWCAFSPEEQYASPSSMKRLARFCRLLASGKLQVRVIPDEIFGLMHGKAGVITYGDGSATSFVGSINETKNAFALNYELIWEDDSPESVRWVQDEFDYFWTHSCAVELCRFVVRDMERISCRTLISIEQWRENENIPSAAVETPVYRAELGLWEHQKYFVELAFREHQSESGARFLLADQVGLGKTVQLAMSAKLMAICGDAPVLVIVPKTLVFQWQEEMLTLLDMPSAVWTGRGWRDETGYFYQADSVRSILKCPRRVGIVSQGLAARRSEAAELLLRQRYECVILDEAHRARRRNPNRDPDQNKGDANYLLQFLQNISEKTHSILLATATPVQVNTIEAFDLLEAIARPCEKIMGDRYSEWRKKPQTMLDMVCGKRPPPDREFVMWDILRNPFPERTKGASKINTLRDSLDLPDDQYVLPSEQYHTFRRSQKDKLKALYTAENFVRNHNPYIRHMIRRTRDYLENTIDPATGEPYLKKIKVVLYGEREKDALSLEGYLRQAYEKAQEFCNMLSSRVRAGGFLSTLMLKRIGSTIQAGENTAKKMLAWTEEGRNILAEEFDEESEDGDGPEETSEIKNLTPNEVECLRELVKLLEMNRDSDPKYNRVASILQSGVEDDPTPWKKQGCIIFSQYYDSARFLAEKLSRDFPDLTIGLYAGGEKSGVFQNGNVQKCSKEILKAQIRDRKLCILVGTDAASEGLNLQTLATLINLDLPWNPTRLEQRKGRIQRIGQLHDKVKIFNLRYRDSVEDKVHKALSGRLNDIYSMFGQIPDTLEDIWIDITTNHMERAMERLDSLPKQNPFTVKYEMAPLETEDWAGCAEVLDKQDVRKHFLRGW